MTSREFFWKGMLIGWLCLAQSACMLLRPERLPGEDAAQFSAQVESALQDEDDSLVAEGPGWQLTVADVERRLATLEGPAAVLLSPTERRGSVVDWLIELNSLAVIAREAGLDDTPEVRFFMNEQVGRQWLRFVTAGLPAPSDEEVEAAWYDDRFGLQLPLRRRLFTLTLDDEQALQSLLAESKRRVDHGGRLWFAELSRAAGEHSTWDAEAAVEGDWYWVTQHDPRLPEWLREAAFEHGLAREPTVVPWEGGFTAVWVTAEMEPSRPSLEDARSWIEESLLRDAQRAAMVERLEALREEMPAEIDASMVERLSAARVGGPAEAWRPRRFEAEGLMEHPATTLGWAQARELVEIQRGWIEGERAHAAAASDETPALEQDVAAEEDSVGMEGEE